MRQGIGNPHATAEYQAALDKLRDEMAKEAGNGNIGDLGEIMTAFLMARPDAAGAILEKGKTLSGAYAAMRDYASKNRGKENGVVIDANKALEIAAGYYGIKGKPPAFRLVLEDVAAPAPAPADAPDALDLDALLSGGAGL